MAVVIVTDSTADMPRQVARDLRIAVVPLYVLIGDKVYRDRVDIHEDEMYRSLQCGSATPTTAQPTPQDFADVYSDLCQGVEGIVSIHVSGKLSGTYGSAVKGRELAKCDCPIEIIDSETVTVGLGIMAVQAARYANRGVKFDDVVHMVKQLARSVNLICLVDTLDYLTRGGRLSKEQAQKDSFFDLKPMLSVKNGELALVDRVNTREKGLDWLCNYAKRVKDLRDVMIAYSMDQKEAEILLARLDSVFPRERIMVTRLGSVLGTHLGPGALVVGMRRGG